MDRIQVQDAGSQGGQMIAIEDHTLEAARAELEAAQANHTEVMKGRPAEDEWKAAESRLMEAEWAFDRAFKRHRLVAKIENHLMEVAA